MFLFFFFCCCSNFIFYGVLNSIRNSTDNDKKFSYILSFYVCYILFVLIYVKVA